MRCDRFREAASAHLDGEPIGMSPAILDGHLATCADCARWADRAATVTRQARLSGLTAPDMAASIMADVVLPTRRVLRRRLLLRVALLVVAFVQLAVAVPSVLGIGLGMAMPEHAAHEGAAWNIAIGVAFLAAALVPRRASGLLPLLTTFILVLAVFSVHDYATGAVSLDRLLTHVTAVLGLVLLVAIDRAERALPPQRFVAPSSPSRSKGLRGVA